MTSTVTVVPAPLNKVGVKILVSPVRKESTELVLAVLEELAEGDREVILLRGVEQLPNTRVAKLLKRSPNAVSLQYNRALERLRSRLPESVFGELEPDD